MTPEDTWTLGLPRGVGSERVTGSTRVPASIGRFELLSELARGARSIVYVAEDRTSRARVALKLMPIAQAVDFPAEVWVAAQLRHPAIVAVRAAGRRGPWGFIAMDLIDGGTLADVVRRAGPLSPLDAMRIFAPILEALSHAHARGIVHRDVKPSNILMTPDGRAVLADFGLALDLWTTRRAGSRAIVGTPAFMPPEQALGHAVDRRADVYAVGASLYECLAGRPPHEAPTFSAMIARVTEDPAAPLSSVAPHVPRRLERVVMRCLEHASDRRFPSVAALRAALARCGSA